jgi:hypothetical protein
MAAPVFLHVANGTATTRHFAEAGIPGRTSIWADPLHEGPVPAGVSDEELVRIRSRFLSDDGRLPVDPVNDLERWRSVIERADYDELVLWYEHDLFDQVNLLQLLSYLASHGFESAKVSMVCIGSFPGRPAFKGLGELTPREIAPLLDVRQPVTRAQYALAKRGWDAFRAPDPTAIEDVLREDTSPLPFLADALRRFLEDYPWTTDGLSRTERRLLQLAQEPIKLWTAFPKMQEGERAYYIADGSFWEIATELSSATPPLVMVDAVASANQALPHGTVVTTPFGRDVLDGRADRIERCGIDRWMGGVHLQGSGPLRRWYPDEARLVNQ